VSAKRAQMRMESGRFIGPDSYALRPGLSIIYSRLESPDGCSSIQSSQVNHQSR
jgi:hypothetical protein